MAYTTNGVPYVQPTDAVSDYPNTSLELANYIDNSRARYVGQYHHNIGDVPAGADRTYNLTGFAFNGEAGDVWSATFSAGTGPMSGFTTAPGKIRLSTASGITLYPSTMATTFIADDDEPSYATYSWRAPAANDYLVVVVYGIGTMVPALWVAANGVINHGGI